MRQTYVGLVRRPWKYLNLLNALAIRNHFENYLLFLLHMLLNSIIFPHRPSYVTCGYTLRRQVDILGGIQQRYLEWNIQGAPKRRWPGACDQRWSGVQWYSR